MVRVAKSHLRFGSIQYFAMTRDGDGLAELVDYAAERHFGRSLVQRARNPRRQSRGSVGGNRKADRLAVAHWQSLGSYTAS